MNMSPGMEPHRRRSRLPAALAALALVWAAGARAEAVPDTCSYLFVAISSQVPLSVGYVNCTDGKLGSSEPTSNIAVNQPTTLIFVQDSSGVSCQFNLMIPGTNTVYTSLVIQQNPCSLHAGNITYRVASGPASFSGVTVGDYIRDYPGMLFVTIPPSPGTP